MAENPFISVTGLFVSWTLTPATRCTISGGGLPYFYWHMNDAQRAKLGTDKLKGH